MYTKQWQWHGWKRKTVATVTVGWPGGKLGFAQDRSGGYDSKGNLSQSLYNVNQRLYMSTVHLRRREMDPSAPRTMYPSSSGITYWQVEDEHSILYGKYPSSSDILTGEHSILYGKYPSSSDITY